MLVVMEAGATREAVESVCSEIRRMGLTAHAMPGATRTAIGITGNTGPVPRARLESLPGVLEVIQVTQPWKLASREVHPDPTVVWVGGERGAARVPIGGARVVVMAGPCAVETAEQTLTIARAVREAGAALLRGGAFKPRTSPYSFQGLGAEGLAILSRARSETGLPIVTEAVDTESLKLVAEQADMVQLGARNMQNFQLLRAAGRCGKPILLKRGLAATLEELFMAAEYVMSEGNYQVVLCERGVRTFADHTRNTLDLSVVPAVKRLSHLPIIVDPSHGTGRRNKVAPLSRAALAVGADGIMVEVHHAPETALSDGPQAIVPGEFAALMAQLRRIAPVVDREL
ncbi:MAG: 3-deoxy-7-phosphoheptulonate synthase [Planctomycetales bacterium]|nr:3-deoxy-7-phosphoheptulonate synthase [Planctomycetales bacterium]